ncbi:hypothetical protein L596_023247 [Steinernema carpocapsae]|uniref:Uncharacterized protein n=1 Tax=Steinernema carpocapsae TaxID=34508 RepID=A0A4U5MDA2_STECR|nr:hypothetical protein L596_023247 [Steinernema carpocapsae]
MRAQWKFKCGDRAISDLDSADFRAPQEHAQFKLIFVFSAKSDHVQSAAFHVFTYFSKTYVVRINSRGEMVDPLFKPNFWNCYALILSDLPRTNNGNEGWHKPSNLILEQLFTSAKLLLLSRRKSLLLSALDLLANLTHLNRCSLTNGILSTSEMTNLSNLLSRARLMLFLIS